jgi:hypothetical protein
MHNKESPKGTLNYTVAFYPCLNVADPEQEDKLAADEKQLNGVADAPNAVRDGVNGALGDSAEGDKEVDSATLQRMAEGEKDQEMAGTNERPKIHIRAEDLSQYSKNAILPINDLMPVCASRRLTFFHFSQCRASLCSSSWKENLRDLTVILKSLWMTCATPRTRLPKQNRGMLVLMKVSGIY